MTDESLPTEEKNGNGSNADENNYWYGDATKDSSYGGDEYGGAEYARDSALTEDEKQTRANELRKKVKWEAGRETYYPGDTKPQYSSYYEEEAPGVIQPDKGPAYVHTGTDVYGPQMSDRMKDKIAKQKAKDDWAAGKEKRDREALLEREARARAKAGERVANPNIVRGTARNIASGVSSGILAAKQWASPKKNEVLAQLHGAGAYVSGSAVAGAARTAGGVLGESVSGWKIVGGVAAKKGTPIAQKAGSSIMSGLERIGGASISAGKYVGKGVVSGAKTYGPVVGSALMKAGAAIVRPGAGSTIKVGGAYKTTPEADRLNSEILSKKSEMEVEDYAYKAKGIELTDEQIKLEKKISNEIDPDQIAKLNKKLSRNKSEQSKLIDDYKDYKSSSEKLIMGKEKLHSQIIRDVNQPVPKDPNEKSTSSNSQPAWAKRLSNKIGGLPKSQQAKPLLTTMGVGSPRANLAYSMNSAASATPPNIFGNMNNAGGMSVRLPGSSGPRLPPGGKTAHLPSGKHLHSNEAFKPNILDNLNRQGGMNVRLPEGKKNNKPTNILAAMNTTFGAKTGSLTAPKKKNLNNLLGGMGGNGAPNLLNGLNKSKPKKVPSNGINQNTVNNAFKIDVFGRMRKKRGAL